MMTRSILFACSRPVEESECESLSHLLLPGIDACLTICHFFNRNSRRQQPEPKPNRYNIVTIMTYELL